MGASWEALEAKENPRGREVGTLLVVAGAEIGGRQEGGKLNNENNVRIRWQLDPNGKVG